LSETRLVLSVGCPRGIVTLNVGKKRKSRAGSRKLPSAEGRNLEKRGGRNRKAQKRIDKDRFLRPWANEER